MKKLYLTILLVAFGIGAMAQQSIQFRSNDNVECVKSDMSSFKADFSFSSLDATTIETSRGELSEIHIEGTFPCGNVGEPQLPMFTRLIAVPTGATPVVTVGAHSETEYTLSDYGIGRVAAMQAPVRKNIDPSTVEYAFSETAYSRNSYNDDPIAMVEVLGTMRGITLGRLIVRPVRYNPAAGTVKVFNDIEVDVDFQNGDAASTEQMFKNTFSPAFNSAYGQIFNIDMLMGGTRDAYTDHPDFYNTPVKMLVICYSGFQGNEALNSWLQWKLQKGYYVDIYYTGSGTNNAGTTSSAIASFIKTKYNASVSAGNAYTYLIVIGDTGQVPYYTRDYEDSTAGYVASDLGYASIDYASNSDDVFPDMYYSRMSVENTTHLTNYINKVLTYERYEFADGGNYLNNVILVGGWDSDWTSLVARPTINYATNYYFNSSNTTYGGFSGGTIKATISTSSTQGYSGTNNGCYQGINNGACFVNYTAHGNKQEWSQPLMTAAQVATLTNTGKYFFAVGNCCLTGNYNSTTTTYSPGSAIGTNACFAETMIRVPNAGAIAYIGCSDYTIWMEDYYWAVGSGIHFNSQYTLQGTATTSNTTTGVYDAMFTDEYWNSASSLLFVGNIAVTAAENNSNGYDTDAGYKYYFKYYHTFGDGSVMPYVTKPETNTVTMPEAVTPGTTSITVNATAGSYVAVTDNSSTIYGVGVANTSGEATVNFTNAIPGSGTLHVVVTRQQYQPYFGTIEILGTPCTITATANPTEGGTVSGAGEYYGNADCTLTATANHGYAFDNWTLGNTVASTESTYTFTVTGDATYTANFHALTEHHITYEPNQTHGTISASPTDAYAGDIITLSAEPAAGYCLYQWHVTTGRAEIPVVNNQFVMPDSDVTISADFTQGFTVTLQQTANGTISADQTTGVQPGAQVTLTATPDDGCEFLAWYVYKTGDANTVIEVVDDSYFVMPASDVTVQAIFVTEEEYEAQVGSGSSTTNGKYLPFRSSSRTNYYSLSQQIYSAEEIGYSGIITAVAFKADGAVTRTLDVYMAHTDLGSFSSTTSWEVMESSDRVFSGSVSFVNGWTTITLDTPFEYDGSSNLNLCIADRTHTTATSRTFSTYGSNSDPYRALYINGTNIDYGANVSVANSLSSYQGSRSRYRNQITFTIKTIGGAASLTLSPGEMNDFSYLEGQGPSDTRKLDIVGVNLGSNITVTAPTNFEISLTQDGSYGSSLTIPFETGNSDMTITPATVYVRMVEGLNKGNYSGTLEAAAGSSLSGSASLSGEVISPNYWTPVQVGPNTMAVIAQVQIDGVPVTNRSLWELGAFCGTECRGSAIGLDNEPVFFLSVYGNEGDQNTFMLYDRAGATVSEGVCHYTATYHDNDVIGTYEAPVVLNFVTMQTFTKEILGYSSDPEVCDRYYLIASPIGEVDPENVNNMLVNSYDLYYFDQSSCDGLLEWVNYEGPDGDYNLLAGKGYLYANSEDVTLAFTGYPYEGSGEVTLTKEDFRFSGWNLVGNPFAETANIGNRAFYRMNSNGTEIVPATEASIAPMEGIFVIAEEDGETLTFITGEPEPGKGAMLVLSILRNRGTAIDRAIVRFDNGDLLPKFQLNPNSTKVYIPKNNKDYAVVNAEEDGEMPVNFKAAANGTYTIGVNSQEVDFRYLHLIDNLTGADIDLLATPSYTFEANVTDHAYRFRLVFVSGSSANSDTFAFYSNGSWIVDNDGDAVLQVIDVTGRLLSSEQIDGCFSKRINAASGVYMLRLVNGERVRTQKIVIE